MSKTNEQREGNKEMTETQSIIELAQLLCASDNIEGCCGCVMDAISTATNTTCHYREVAKRIIMAGYRKQTQKDAKTLVEAGYGKVAEAKAEGAREFAKRVQHEFDNWSWGRDICDDSFFYIIDELLNELLKDYEVKDNEN